MQAVVELDIEISIQPARLHALDQVKPQVQIARIGGIKTKPGTGLGLQHISRRTVRYVGRIHHAVQTLQRFSQQRAVNRFLVLKITIDGTGRIACRLGNFANARAFNAKPLKNRTRSVQHQRTARVVQGLLALESGLHGQNINPNQRNNT